MTGTAAQLRGMRDLAVQIMHERDPDALHTLVLTELLRACHAEAAVCKEADWQPDEGAVSIVTAPAARSGFDHPQASRLIRIGRPFAEHYAATGDSAPRQADALGRLQHLRDVRPFTPWRALGLRYPTAWLPLTRTRLRTVPAGRGLRPGGPSLPGRSRAGGRRSPLGVLAAVGSAVLVFGLLGEEAGVALVRAGQQGRGGDAAGGRLEAAALRGRGGGVGVCACGPGSPAGGPSVPSTPRSCPPCTQ
ncbi:hypothetical protein OOK13_01240 [Streptomyces sp. NBC_00378]|uniref:hypothetical protein n=1 Tax=unclassified Streptomyces TaxID=2593676 RepID=UPI002251B1AC|nr:MULTISPECIES: hypothetical protein [unclassified Streptomyces]MCX5107187.1 hypothetical protein [Streptomyces sp. NBC_00378]